VEVQHRARSCSFGLSLSPMTFAPWAGLYAILLCHSAVLLLYCAFP
jgi:hypothetical protein